MRLSLLPALAAALALVGPSSAAARERPERTLPAPSGPVKADRDRDGVFDDLERRVRRLRAEQRLPVIVTLERPATADRVDALRRDAGGFSVSHRYRIIDAFSATVRAGQVRALAARSDVVHVEEDSAVHALNDGAQASFGVTKARLDAPQLDGDADGALGLYSRDDLVAAVIDTGIDAGHGDLDEGKVIAFKDYVNGRPSPYDDEGHGTHVAATIAGEGDARVDGLHRGVAPAAALVGLKVLDSTGEGAMSDVAAAIDWAVANRSVHGIEVINLSLGAAGCADGSDAASKSVDAAHDAGLVVAVAAGNEGPGTCTVGTPGAARKALTVGAMADRSAGGFYQAYFSSRGRTADGRVKPDVSAPGVDITSAAAGTATGYVAYSGTSMATPFVAGLALLMRDAAALDSDAVRRHITETAVDWGRGGDNRTSGTSGPDIDYGSGRLDAYAALTAAGAPLTAPPAAPVHRLAEGSFSAAGQQADFPLEVSDTSFPIAATMIMSDVAAGSTNNPDFDLYLLGPDGTQRAASTYTTRQEEVFHQPAAPGTYTVRVVARRGSGRFFVDLSGGAPADVVPPDTTIGAGPSGTTTSRTAEFSFGSSEGSSTFECRLDGGAWAACTSPKAYGSLADGLHTFAVRARDAAGNPDPTPATRTWTVDATPPDTTISSGPSTPTNETTATFAFASSESGATFECRLDGGTWGTCASPKTYTGLADSSHSFAVRAKDGLGNADATPATHGWTVDTTAPSTTITSGPATSTDQTSATFSFTSSEAGSTFRCRLDGAAWSACTSPKGYSDVGAGSHTFEVSATDAAGNLDPTPATHGWTVDTTGPDTTITAAPRDPINESSATFGFTSSEAGATFECRLDEGAWGTCASPRTQTGLRDGPHSFAVRAKDALGNADATPATHSWTIDTAPPDTTITAAPAAATTSTSATFSFASSEAGSVFACSLDADPWTTGCTSPQEYGGLSTGTHAFRVRAMDAAGNVDPTPASHTWTIDSDPSTAGTTADGSTTASGTTTPPQPAPGRSASAGEAARSAGALLMMDTGDVRTALRRGLPITFTCDGGCRAVVRAYVTRRTALRLGLRSGRALLPVGRLEESVTGDGPATVSVRLTQAARRAIARSRGVRLLLRAQVTDASGTRSLSRWVALSRRTLAVARRRGLRGTLTCTSDCTGTARLVVSRRTAAKLGLGSRRLGWGSATLDGAAETQVVVRLTRRASSRLRGARRVRAALKTRVSWPSGLATRLAAPLLLSR